MYSEYDIHRMEANLQGVRCCKQIRVYCYICSVFYIYRYNADTPVKYCSTYHSIEDRTSIDNASIEDMRRAWLNRSTLYDVYRVWVLRIHRSVINN